jgi:hypothetical protein
VPTFRFGDFLFRFYSSDGVEPPHVHILRADKEAKVWLRPGAFCNTTTDTLNGSLVRCCA